MDERGRILVVVHPGSACGSADFNLGAAAGAARETLAAEIMTWQHDMLVVDGELSDEISHYAILSIAFENASDHKERRLVRTNACDTTEGWPAVVNEALETGWPGGPHDVLVTGAWVHDDGGGCVNAVAEAIGAHRVTVASSALRLP